MKTQTTTKEALIDTAHFAGILLLTITLLATFIY